MGGREGETGGGGGLVEAMEGEMGGMESEMGGGVWWGAWRVKWGRFGGGDGG